MLMTYMYEPKSTRFNSFALLRSRFRKQPHLMAAATIPIENGQQVGILVTSSISILIVIVAVGLRLVAKKIADRIDYSDYCILAAAVGRILYKKTMIVLTYLLAI